MHYLEDYSSYYFSDHTLNTLDPECSSKWKKYLQLKQHFYMAYVSPSEHEHQDVCDRFPKLKKKHHK